MPTQHSLPSLSRRDMFKWSAAGLTATSTCGWFEQLAARGAEAARQGVKHKSCILLWMDGGPGQIFTFDPRPTGFKAISTSVPGIEIAEALPRVSQQMQHLALLRSMTTTEFDHGRAHYEMHTGFRAGAGISFPSIGSIVCSEIADPEFELPNYITSGFRPSRIPGPGHLGPLWIPTTLDNPAAGLEDLQAARQLPIEKRVSLIQRLDARFQQEHGVASAEAHRRGYEGIVRLLKSPKAAAFDLDQEPAKNRARYGSGEFADRCLMARRLVEQGVPFVEVVLPGWDTHSQSAERSKELTAQLDQPMAALIADLHERDLLDDTLLIWMGEFGRDPRSGRGHFPTAWTSVLGGAGLQTGQVVGRCNPKGTEVVDRPIKTGDFMATILHALGIDYHKQYSESGERPVTMVAEDSQHVEQLFG
ncbi:DUF1501 domain-containing protein [Lignipirellula cremea]|uniref:Sulfatase n=1 Tax=Lignipirellula cremea TaxID=2528010 RepID=A0A518DXQ5_9BACT|nr:DUF1501 domain-containing protein [Lignipirellula cremea]QDU96623.1 hypothetical protein Pla8534_44440 [Lignipirellula cremea]